MYIYFSQAILKYLPYISLFSLLGQIIWLESIILDTLVRTVSSIGRAQVSVSCGEIGDHWLVIQESRLGELTGRDMC